MIRRDARRLERALRALVDDCLAESLDGNPLSTRERLFRRITRHLPIEGAEKASEFAPPMWVLGLARKFGVKTNQAIATAVAGAVYFSTADLADDIADGDLTEDLGVDVTDVCRLTFLYQQAIERIPDISAQQRVAIAGMFARRGQQMADGQELDLRGTDAWESASPEVIARNKSGAEFAAMGELLAIVTGQDRAAWSEIGSAYGTAAQIVSDYFDLFLDPESDDWATGKPTLPIRGALDDPNHRGAVLELMAGRRDGPRQVAGLWHLVQADASRHLKRAIEQLGAEMTRGGIAVEQLKRVAPTRDAVVEIAGTIAEALDEYKNDPRPEFPRIEDVFEEATRSTVAFIEARSDLSEAMETHRWGLFGESTVVSDLFGPAVVCDLLLDIGQCKDIHVERCLSTVDPDGARYYRTRTRPPDAMTTAALLRVGARTGRRDRPFMSIGVDALVANARRDGLIHTWLADGSAWRRGPLDREFKGRICAGVSAEALLALWTVDPDRFGNLVTKGARSLADRLCGVPLGRQSMFFGPVAVDALACRLLLSVRPTISNRHRAAFDEGLRAAGARLSARRNLTSRFGNTLETALASVTLARLAEQGLAALEQPIAIMRALIDEQQADGGYPADRYFRAPAETMKYDGLRSRLITSAHVQRTLLELDRYGRR